MTVTMADERTRRPFPVPESEVERLQALTGYRILHTYDEPEYDELTQLASRVTNAPIAMVSLVSADKQWFKSRVGIDLVETPREHSFCTHTILTPHQPFVVGDALRDERFRDNPYVVNAPGVRSYLGVALKSLGDEPVGTLCVLDFRPRRWTKVQMSDVMALGHQVEAQLELRRAVML